MYVCLSNKFKPHNTIYSQINETKSSFRYGILFISEKWTFKSCFNKIIKFIITEITKFIL